MSERKSDERHVGTQVLDQIAKATDPFPFAEPVKKVIDTAREAFGEASKGLNERQKQAVAKAVGEGVARAIEES